MKRYGFIRDKFEIKFLILFAVSRAGVSVTFDEISEMALCDDAIDYFEYTECVAELVESGHLCKDGGHYGITPAGIDSAAMFEKNIAASVREKVIRNAKTVKERIRRASMVHGSVLQRGDGAYTAALGLDDDAGSVMKLELMCASSAEAERLKSLFVKNAERIYNSVLKAILEADAE